MTTLYGQRGQPIGSIDSDAVYDVDGVQILVRDGANLFLANSGVYAGSYYGAVVFNIHGFPQGFAIGAKKALAPLPPRLSMLPPRMIAKGPQVRGLPEVQIPAFLRERLPQQDDLRDGFFA